MTTAFAIATEVASPADARPSFAAAAEEHLSGVLRYLTHVTGDRHLAEDLTSATFERALRDWHRFDPDKGSARVWLIEVSRRVALDHFRSETRRRRRDTTWSAREPQAAPAPETEVSDLRLRQALSRLSRAERELIALRVVLEFDTAETARIADRSPSGVSTSLHRALGKLRREMEADDAPAG